MKAPKEQVIEYVEKRYQKEKEKWNDGLINQYFEWEDVKNQIFQVQDNSYLYNRIIELENKLKHIRDKYGINEEEVNMKKKIRDLSTEECRKICEDRDCIECPFIHVLCGPESPNSWIHHQELYSDLFLDQEVEVEDDK